MQEKGNWKPVNSKTIIFNINRVFKYQDIDKLSKYTYSFVMNISGFIAHYDLYGFRNNYCNLDKFAQDLYNNCTPDYAYREGNDKDFIKWYGKDYCKSKEEAISGIREIAKNYLNKINR